MTDLSTALSSFIDGEDTSLAAANRLEVLLDKAYPEDGLVQERVIDLASYRPGGGEFLFDTAEMQGRLARLRDHLLAQSLMDQGD